MTYLERIAKIVSRDTIPQGERHVGDDAAVLKPFVGEAIISTDVSVLGVHLEETFFPSKISVTRR
jgi:thiamine monophosphate kinase